MKNVRTVSGRPYFRVNVEGMPPLRGWALRYLSGMGSEIKSGYWMSQWFIDSSASEAVFNFEPELHMCFNDEAYAKSVEDLLRRDAEIETEVVKI